MTEANNSVTDSLTSIKQWFTNYDKHEFYSNSFTPPANDLEIKRVEEKLGIDFPRDFIESYKNHDGFGYGLIADGGEFLSLSALESTWIKLHSVMEDNGYSLANTNNYISEYKDALNNDEYPPEYDSRIKPFPFWPKWVPFMDQDGNTIWYIDLDPNQGGKIGQVIKVIDFDKSVIVADSFKEFIADYLQELLDGKYTFDSLGNITEVKDLKKTEKKINASKMINQNVELNIKFEEIGNLRKSDLFTIIGIITCEDHFMNEIKQYRASLKKTAFIERAKLKTKELSIPKLAEDECFILIGDNHLILKKPPNSDLSELTIEKVVETQVEVLSNGYQLIEYKLLN